MFLVPLISDQTIDQVAAATDIVEVIGSYFRLQRAGTMYKALCPFHQERTPSFSVNPQRQIFKCFGCGAGGSVFRFVMDYEKVDFPTAVRRLAERAGIRVEEEELSPEDISRMDLRRRLLALHGEAAEWFHRRLMKTPAAQTARDYLKRRGINAETAKRWQIGYAPDAWEALAQWARGAGYSMEELVKSGLVTQREERQGVYDRFRDRVMFPICNDLGEVIAFSGRVLEAEAKAAKYVNSPETMLFTKGAVLFGLHRSKRALLDKKCAIVCEGQLDLITAFEAGVENVIAPQGTAFTEQQARILRRYVEEVVLCFDADGAGEKAAERSLTCLLAESLSVRVAEMPPGEDPDSLIRTKGAETFRALVGGARDYFDVQLSRLASRPEYGNAAGRAQAARKLAGAISLVKDAMLREALVHRMANRLEISPEEFARQVRLGKAPEERKDGEAAAATKAKAKPPELDQTIRLLLTAILHDEEARRWMLAAPWRDLLANEPGGGLLARVLEGHEQLEHALHAFLATLPPEEEAALSGVLHEKAPPHPVALASDCWNQMVRRQIQRRIDTFQARLRQPGISAEETLNLQKQILDQRTHLLNIARPSSPPI